MAVLSKTEISALSTQERLALIDDLWESLEAPLAMIGTGGTQVPDWQRRILDERLLDVEICPGDDLSLAEARGQSLPRPVAPLMGSFSVRLRNKALTDVSRIRTWYRKIDPVLEDRFVL